MLLNAAGALAAYDGPVTDLDTALAAGLERAAGAIDSGAAERLLGTWAEVSTRLKG
ncbi:hypothetical protein GCM10010472_62920 [Pseudonocardia halophobica]